jgi:hypothetical protein
MRRLGSVVALFLLLSAAAPILACMTGAAMSQEESACCRAMHGQCGEMAKMGCCRIEARHDLPQVATQPTALPVQWVVASLLEPVALALPSSASVLWKLTDEHSPPGLVAVQSTVLRI